MDLPGPFDLLELADTQSIVLHPVNWEEGDLEIHPRDGRPSRVVKVLRVFVDPSTKSTEPKYYDITSQLAIPTIRAILAGAQGGYPNIKLTKVGFGPSARFMVQTAP